MLKADILPPQALEMAAFAAGGDLSGLTHHSDHGSNYMAMVYTDRSSNSERSRPRARSATATTTLSRKR